MKGLNLSSFKKVKEDAQSATMRHDDGHELRIAKGALPALQRKQLERLPVYAAEGAAPINDPRANSEATPDNPTGTDPAQPLPEPQNLPGPSADASSIQTPVSGGASGDWGPSSAPAVTATAEGAAPNTEAPQSPNPASIAESPTGGLAKEKAANLEMAAAEAAKGNAIANAAGTAVASNDALPTQQDIILHHQQADVEAQKAYLDQKIDPYRLYHSPTTFGKIASAVGLILTGFAGKAGNDMMNQAIERDVNAQRLNQDQKYNLWKMNREALGTDLAANLATQSQLWNAAKYQVMQAENAATGPVEKARAHQQNAIIDQNINMLHYKQSFLRPNQSDGILDPSQKLQAMQQLGMVPPDIGAKIAESINAAKNTVANSQGIDEAFWQAAADSRPFTGGTGTSIATIIPGRKTPGQEALQARLGPTFQDVEGTVRQAAMDNADKNMTPRFGDSDEHIMTKWKSLQDYKASKASAALPRAYGIDLTRHPATNVGALRGAPPPAQAQAQMGRLPTKGGASYVKQNINGKSYMVPVR